MGEIDGSSLFNPPTLYQFQRSSVTGAFGGQTTLTVGISGLRTTLDDRTAVWSAIDGPDATVLENQRLFIAQRPSATDPFPFDAAAKLFHADGGYEISPLIRGDGQELFFLEVNQSVAEYQAFADSGFLNAAIAPSVEGGGFAMSADGLVMYQAAGASGMQVLTRPTVDSPFGKPQSVSFPDAGNPQWNYAPVAISADYCTVYVYEDMTTQEQDGGFAFAGQLFVTHKTP